ncbi:serine/threonine-protein kinase [Planococcus sp. X10-3]|uniref:serine/threonine-protein kinase n=1 Tax=Planococcus sp. X10-3 TaxID=3061240 RepID=UPI003BB056BF
MIEINNRFDTKIEIEKVRSIGLEGKNSEVWLARDRQIEEMVVLKEISKVSLEKQYVDDYFLEAKILNAVSHPNIMPIRYASQDEKNIYIVMPHFYNGSIESQLNDRIISAREIIKYALEFLSGLLYIHIKGYVHLDIKPTNILIDNNGKAVITDFGLSKFLNEKFTITQPIGYIMHSSPQAFETSERSLLDDIYQSGLTLYRMSYGNEVFKKQFDLLRQETQGDNDLMAQRIRNGNFPDRNYSLPHLPNRLRKIIKKMLEVNPEQRYQSVLEVINELSKIDDRLDWEMEIETDKNTMYVWKHNRTSNIISLNLKEKDGVFLTYGQKYVKNSKGTQNLLKVKKEFLKFKDALKHIEKMIEEYS